MRFHGGGAQGVSLLTPFGSQARETHSMSLRLPGALLMCASHVVVPVHEIALRVVPPRPYVKLEEGRYVEPVWAVDVQEHLTFQNWRTGVVLRPGRSEGNKFDADQLHSGFTGRRFSTLQLGGSCKRNVLNKALRRSPHPSSFFEGMGRSRETQEEQSQNRSLRTRASCSSTWGMREE